MEYGQPYWFTFQILRNNNNTQLIHLNPFLYTDIVLRPKTCKIKMHCLFYLKHNLCHHRFHVTIDEVQHTFCLYYTTAVHQVTRCICHTLYINCRCEILPHAESYFSSRGL